MFEHAKVIQSRVRLKHWSGWIFYKFYKVGKFVQYFEQKTKPGLKPLRRTRHSLLVFFEQSSILSVTSVRVNSDFLIVINFN